jgi:cellulose synthase/poly-beta-1,6-N-acetylglucosamine synthase-like glycosyltransferase/spore germination protein YaaH/peptidoglycan/xylan/chitin deacetylase (PgdA/CDA1 family)
MSSRPIFYDPKQRRRKRARWATFVAIAATLVLLVLFGRTIAQAPLLPSTIWPTTSFGLRPFIRPASRQKKRTRPRKILEVTSPGAPRPDPIRAAFYVDWDPTSFTALRQNHRAIDLLIPEWMHVTTADGHIEHEDDTQVLDWLRSTGITMPVMPMINNFVSEGQAWRSKEVAQFLADRKAEESFFQQIEDYIRIRSFPGVVLDFEEVPEASQPALRKFVAEFATRMHALGAKFLMTLPASDDSYDYHFFGQTVDSVILMNYDEHWPQSSSGPVASHSWFVQNLRRAVGLIAREKLLVGIGSYGYDWSLAHKKSPAHDITFQEALVTAQESDSTISFDPESLNPHYEYYDDENNVHSVWFLDGISAYNQVMESDRASVAGEVIWRLGSEDPSIWGLFVEPDAPASHRDLLESTLIPYDLERNGSGELLRIEQTPQNGKRSFHFDTPSGLITESNYDTLPVPYTLQMFGAVPDKIVLSFDDGPDPSYTPKILDVLKSKRAPAVFFAVGLPADKYAGLLQRIYAEGHEIGNHTFTHPDISELSPSELQWELNLTQRLYESVLGAKTVFFRPPYDLDADPDTPAEVAPLEIVEKLGYFTVGDKIDTKDYLTREPAEIISSVMAQLSSGNIILMHDGGGDRRATVAALPEIIDRVRAAGKEIVPLRALLAQKGSPVQARAVVMPPLDPRDRWAARVDLFVFDAFRYANTAIAWLFLAGIFLAIGRLAIVGALAVYQKLAIKPPPLPEDFRPRVTVLIPAYNEEAVIVRTVNSVLASDWPNLDVMIVDDGSKDGTHAELLRSYGDDPRVKILHQSNCGKPAAMNLGLSQITADITVGVDADTRIHPAAIRNLVRHFIDPRLAAVAGNAKVGNRHNMLTRWQALEYITSQNLERRAFDVLNCITVVPGALGAWRTSVVRECGGYSHDTVAEDADLTLSILRRGYRIAYDEDAVAWTEAPERWGDLLRQRFRWTFGTLQTVWKHSDTLVRKRYGTLGWIALPNVFIFQILLPMFSPTVDLMLAGSLALWAAARALERWPLFILPQAFAVSTGNLERTLLFFFVFTFVDLLACELAFLMEKGESQLLLLWVLPQRFAYRQMMYFVLFRTMIRAIQGSSVGWGRVERVSQPAV